jgi:DNA-binding transcriptional regulator YiaG
MREGFRRKIQGRYVYHGFGFPVVLIRVPMVLVRGAWTPEVNYNGLSRRLLEVLVAKPSRLTGAEVHFVRHSFQMTLEEFAGRFGVTHPAVIKWEGKGNQPTAMAWAIEKDLRLEILRASSKARPERFLKAYLDLERMPGRQGGRLEISIPQSA